MPSGASVFVMPFPHLPWEKVAIHLIIGENPKFWGRGGEGRGI